MYTPQTYAAAMTLIIVSVFFWGSWPNFSRALPKWRLEYFYLDFTFGFLLTVVVCGATLGSPGLVGGEFIGRLAAAGGREAGSAALAGFVWNVGNVLLLNAIMIAGLSIAFPTAIVIAVILGVGMSYYLRPIGDPFWLGGGVVILLGAAVANAVAYRYLNPAAGTSKSKGIVLSLIAGVLIGLFAPFVTRATTGPGALDTYSVMFFFNLGAFVVTMIAVPILLAHPLIGEKGKLGGYLKGKATWHLMGMIGGAIWCVGTVVNFLSAGLVGLAISWAIGSGSPMVGAMWGIFLWKEFAGSSPSAKTWITISSLLYVIGIVSVALSY